MSDDPKQRSSPHRQKQKFDDPVNPIGSAVAVLAVGWWRNGFYTHQRKTAQAPPLATLSRNEGFTPFNFEGFQSTPRRPVERTTFFCASTIDLGFGEVPKSCERGRNSEHSGAAACATAYPSTVLTRW